MAAWPSGGMSEQAYGNEFPRVGPGRLVLIVGPSGAGKDTVLAHVRAAMAGSDRIHIPRRVVTRVADGTEDHDTLSDAAFQQAAAEGAFMVWWDAHGHSYGIPASAEDAVRAGRTVICNVSRTVLAPLRLRFAAVTVVLVTAPIDVLAQRLTARARKSDGDVAERLARGDGVEFAADVVIMNVDTPDAAAARLLDAVFPARAGT